MKNPVLFTPKEEKIRKRWFFWQITIPTIVLMPFLCINQITSFILLTFFVFNSFIPYIFAYRNFETAYLFSYIIIAPAALAFCALPTLQFLLFIFFRYDNISLIISFFAIPVLYFIWLIYINCRLIKINAIIKNRILPTVE
jgi:hypothetical protein